MCPEKAPCDAWDWFSVEDLHKVVDSALEDTMRVSSMPCPSDEDLEGWYSREEFVERLAFGFGLRLAELARLRGLQGPPGASERLARWVTPGDSGCAALAGVTL